MDTSPINIDHVTRTITMTSAVRLARINGQWILVIGTTTPGALYSALKEEWRKS